MAETENINVAYNAYAIAKQSGSEAEMRRLYGEVYLHAERMAVSCWGHQEQQYFDDRSQRLIHEENWNNLERIVTACLKAYDPNRKAKFSTYLMKSFIKQKSRSTAHVTRQKRKGQQNEQSLPEGFDMAVGDATEFSASDKEIIQLIKRKLKGIHRDNLEPYLIYHTNVTWDSDNLAKEVGKKFGVTDKRINQRFAIAKKQIGEILWSAYDDYVDDRSATLERDETTFARCLQAAMQELLKEYGEKDVIQLIKSSLKTLPRDDLEPYIISRTENETPQQVAKKFCASARRITQSIAKVDKQIGELLQPIQDGAPGADEKTFARCLQAAMQELAEEYGDREITRLIKARLKIIPRNDLKPYVAYHTENTTWAKVGKTFGIVSPDDVRKNITRVDTQIRGLLKPMHDDYIATHPSTTDKGEKIFARSEQLALQELAKEYKAKAGIAG